jgi:transcriptional regulator with XRE-family HTH domain
VNEVDEIQISGRKFARSRHKLVLTQEELAAKLEMSSSNLRRIERSQLTTISPKYFRRLAEIRGIAYEALAAELSPDETRKDAAGISPDTERERAVADEAVKKFLFGSEPFIRTMVLAARIDREDLKRLADFLRELVKEMPAKKTRGSNQAGSRKTG